MPLWRRTSSSRRDLAPSPRCGHGLCLCPCLFRERIEPPGSHQLAHLAPCVLPRRGSFFLRVVGRVELMRDVVVVIVVDRALVLFVADVLVDLLVGVEVGLKIRFGHGPLCSIMCSAYIRLFRSVVAPVDLPQCLEDLVRGQLPAAESMDIRFRVWRDSGTAEDDP